MARALQGLGGGGLMALAQTIIADIVSPLERGRYQGYIGAVFATSSVGGPVLGGFLTEHIDWSLIFWINLPLGLVALGMTSNVLRRVPFRPRKHRLDVIGAALMMCAAIALLLALSWGGRRYEWISPQTGALLLLSAILWGLFAWRLVMTREPFLPLAVLGNPVVRCATLAGACNMGTLVGMTIFVPLYFETVLHLSASQSGLALIPLMAATVTASTITGRMMTYMVHYKRVSLIGLMISILSLAPLAIWPASMPTVLVLLLLLVIGAGLGTVFPVSTVCMQNAVSRSQMGVATGAANFFRALFSALVVAVLGAIVLGGLGGVTGMSVEMLARTASAPGTRLCVPFRISCLRLGAFLRHGVPDCDGRAATQGTVGAITGRDCAHRSCNADPRRIEIARYSARLCEPDRPAAGLRIFDDVCNNIESDPIEQPRILGRIETCMIERIAAIVADSLRRGSARH